MEQVHLLLQIPDKTSQDRLGKIVYRESSRKAIQSLLVDHKVVANTEPTIKTKINNHSKI